ncbi:hypothetical protein SDC9_197936 [bioreactor metagenome]|uniref:Uncharacterized protein n=1 Tax=bioreactor metagenome TaxID=1076179 RepID=A0A645IGS7_9ZZZZ
MVVRVRMAHDLHAVVGKHLHVVRVLFRPFAYDEERGFDVIFIEYVNKILRRRIAPSRVERY